ncbi:MAG: ABC transporter substrate-binding protein [Chloroflexi bacterium]|nr:ABC transporter substrate-binding protein [Chloroflexota bacterium]
MIASCAPSAGPPQQAPAAQPAQPATPLAQQAKPAAPAPQPATPSTAPTQAVKPAGEAKKLVITSGIDASFTDLVVAVKKGFFDKYNIQAEYKPFEDGNVALDAVLTGASDLGDSSETAGLVRRSKGGNIWIAGTGPSTPNLIGIVAKDTINTPKDIEGKKVGFPRGSGAHLFFGKYVAHHKLDESKMQIVTLPTPESMAAMRRGDVDVLFLWDPWMTRIVREIPNTKILGYSGDEGIHTLRQYYYFGQRLTNDKELGVNVLKGLVEANGWIKGNVDESAQILGATFNLPTAEAKDQIQRYEWGTTRFTPEIKRAVEDAAKWLLSIKVIDTLPNLDEYLRPEFMKQAAPDRVTGY